MARGQAKSNIKNNGGRPSVLNQGKQLRGIKKQAAVHKSARLQAIENLRKQFAAKSNHTWEKQTPSSPPMSNVPTGKKASQHSYVLHSLPESSGKRKRGKDVRHCGSQSRDQPPSKRPRTSPLRCIDEGKILQGATGDTNENSPDPLQYWIQTGRWCKEYFEQDSQVRDDFERGKSPEELEQRDWLQEHYARQPFIPMHGFHPLQHWFARKKSSASLRRKNSQSTLQTPSDQLPREIKSAQYRNPEYQIELERKGSFMRKSPLGVTDTSKSHCRTMLEKEQIFPQNTLFRDDLFDETCESMEGRNEAMIIRDISPLICPSAQVLRIYGAKHLNHLYESVNEGWNSAIPFHGTRPQPDYSVGFGYSAFTEEQLEKLEPFVGVIGSKMTTYFTATTRMYFPFLTCEVKCGAAALDIADRQNAHSMTVALRALVDFFRLVKREKELDREILAFSISHDHRSVRIYGHCPVIEGDKTTFYRHPIHEFSFTALDGKEKWTTYQFVKNVYDHHSLKLHQLICSGIDGLPAGINFDPSQSASFSQTTPQSSQQSNVGSMLGEDDSQSSFLVSQEVTPTTSFTQTTERASKKPRNQRAAGQ
ncbi:hypothetical protein MMC29_000213 [Sticta canariensis]|nr:hypothetical protein [Sticta canariensis]